MSTGKLNPIENSSCTIVEPAVGRDIASLTPPRSEGYHACFPEVFVECNFYFSESPVCKTLLSQSDPAVWWTTLSWLRGRHVRLRGEQDTAESDSALGKTPRSQSSIRRVKFKHFVGLWSLRKGESSKLKVLTLLSLAKSIKVQQIESYYTFFTLAIIFDLVAHSLSNEYKSCSCTWHSPRPQLQPEPSLSQPWNMN